MRYPHAVLVVIDGLRPDVVSHEVMPGLHELGERFWRAEHAVTVQPSITVAALTSLATGVEPGTHGLIEPGLRSLGALRSIRPLPRELERIGVRTTVVMGELGGSARLIAGTLLRMAGIENVLIPSRSPASLVSETLGSVSRPEPGLTILYLNGVDQAGHRCGWMSTPYLDAAWEIDLALRPLFSLVDLQDLLLVITSDHGGGGLESRDHDCPHPDNEAIPLILAGPGVRRGRTSQLPVGLLDVPPTLIHAFGGRAPASYEGRVLTEALTAPKSQLATNSFEAIV